MKSRSFVRPSRIMAAALLVAMAPAAFGRNNNTDLQNCSFVVGDVLVAWQSGKGTTVAYRGIPLLVPNPAGEFVIHRAWQDVYYRSQSGKPRATLTEAAEETVLTIRDRTNRFALEKRVIVRPDASVRLEYAYELLDPADAELQVLFGFAKQWTHGSKYRLVANGDNKVGELECPKTKRIDLWSGATQQVFTTDYGTLTLKAKQGLSMYCTPGDGALWWVEKLKKGKKYNQIVDIKIEPGPAAETGLVLSSIEWPDLVRNGKPTFTLQLAKTPAGPDRVCVHAELVTDGKTDARIAGKPVEVELTETPAEVCCSLNTDRNGDWPFAAVIASETDGKQLLRIEPLHVELSRLVSVQPRLSLYTSEKEAEIVVRTASDVALEGLLIRLEGDGIRKTQHAVSAHRIMLPVDLTGLADGVHSLSCRVFRKEELLAETGTQLRKAAPKANEVKIDNLTRGLVVDGLPFLPFGYYAYYPLAEGVMDEEVVRGFTLFSPYHGGPHVGDTLKAVKKYMDRCAAIGMKVNFHLMWANKAQLSDEQWAALRAEVEAFRDHPALLSWYVADEPTADRIPNLQKIHDLLKELDPHHPLTVVFYRGAEHARKFAGVMDIVMGDPYPIPQRPVTMVSDMADSLNEAFDFKKPLWIVPQAFGGNEAWRREPTAAEQRVMTYLALIHGARGIQYFVRAPRTSFPKSPIMWAECATLALETAELTPTLLSAELQPQVASSAAAVHAQAYRDRGIVTVLAANTQNHPLIVRLALSEIDYTGEADVLFEDRRVPVRSGAIEEPIDAFGTRAYAIPVGPMPKEDLSLDPHNLTVNPSYEHNPSVGTPAGCYARIPPAATLFVDSRVARHGRHSLRMAAPANDKTPSISPFPVSLKGGRAYRVSIWAKANSQGTRLDVSLGSLGKEQFALTTRWQEYTLNVKPERDMRRAGPGIGLGSAGVAWLDLFQIAPAADAKKR